MDQGTTESPRLDTSTAQLGDRRAVVDSPTPAALRRLAPTLVPVTAVGLLLGIRRAELPLGDSDVLWGTRTGLDMLSSGRLPHNDTYSWTAPGRPWTPNSWGWDMVLGSAHRVGGLLAIAALGIVLVAAIAALVGLAAARVGAKPAWTAIVFAPVALFALHELSPRPQVIAYLMIFAIPPLLPAALYGDRRRAVKAVTAICLLQVVWMNLHTSAVLGPVLLAAAGVGLLLRPGQTERNVLQQAGRLVIVLGLAAGCCLLTPYGTAPLSNIEEVRRASVGLIREWTPAGFHGAGPILGVVAIAVGAAAGWLAFRARRFDTVAILAVFAVATASAIRFTPMLLLYVIPEFAVLAGKLRARPVFLSRMVVAGCAVLVVFGISGARSFARLDAKLTSPTLVAALPQGCRLVNDYTVGGAVILARPDVKVSVDGRNDMYGRTLLLSVEGMLSNDPGTTARIDNAGVNCVLTQSSDKLVKALLQGGKWRVAGTDPFRTLLLRVGGN